MPRNRFYDIIRDDDGNPVTGVTGAIKVIDGGATLIDDTTAADGVIAFTEAEIGYPGPIYLHATDGTTTRIRYGTVTGQSGPLWLNDLPRAFQMMTDGVVSGVDTELAVTADGGGMDVTVANGLAFVNGLPSYWPVSEDLTIAPNAAGNPRIDLIVIRAYPVGTANEGKQLRAVIQGTAAATPSAPSVTTDPATIWEIALAEVLVGSGVAAITSDKVTDVRTYSSGPLMDNSVTTAKLVDLAVETAKLDDNATTAAKMSTIGPGGGPPDGAIRSTTAIARVLKAPLSGQTPAWETLKLSELNDVAETVPADTNVLKWDAATNKWIPGPTSSFDAATLAGVMHAATGKTTPVDADELALIDSAASNVLKKVTWANIKATAKAYFDTIYAALTHTHSSYPTLSDMGTNEYFSPISVGTSGADVASVSLTLLNGVTYDCICFADMQAGAPTSTGSYTQAFALIATGSSTPGVKTGTAGGERWIGSMQSKVVVGTGAAVSFKARANTDGGTGTINSATVRAIATPRNIPAS